MQIKMEKYAYNYGNMFKYSYKILQINKYNFNKFFI